MVALSEHLEALPWSCFKPALVSEEKLGCLWKPMQAVNIFRANARALRSKIVEKGEKVLVPPKKFGPPIKTAGADLSDS